MKSSHTHENFTMDSVPSTYYQFLEIINRKTIRIEIWERGAGYTLASGSSSCAAASVAHRLDLCDEEIVVLMPGGKIDIKIGRHEISR